MICVSVGNVTIEDCLSIIKTSQMAEIRLDLIEGSAANIKRIFSSSKNLIATYRPNNILSDDDRANLLIEAIDAGAEYVDIEMESSVTFKVKVMEEAKNKGKKIIVSYHNCETTPSREELENIVHNCKKPLSKRELTPDILKIACVSHSQKDNIRLLSLLDSDVPIIVVGMGKTGRITRFLAPFFGAFCTFAGVSKANQTAFGQPTKEELEFFFREFKNYL